MHGTQALFVAEGESNVGNVANQLKGSRFETANRSRSTRAYVCWPSLLGNDVSDLSVIHPCFNQSKGEENG
jgi:hypothetical protein